MSQENNDLKEIKDIMKGIDNDLDFHPEFRLTRMLRKDPQMARREVHQVFLMSIAVLATLALIFSLLTDSSFGLIFFGAPILVLLLAWASQIYTLNRFEREMKAQESVDEADDFLSSAKDRARAKIDKEDSRPINWD